MADRSTMNPWSTKDGSLGVRLGDPQSGLTLARRHGLLDVTSKHQVYEDEVESQLAKNGSLRMIRILREISQLNSELQELELEIHRQLLDKEMADFIHTDVLERRLWQVDILLNHLTDVVTNKDTVVDRLQSKAAENSLMIEAKFQKHAKSILSSLGSSVTHLPSHCDHVKWIGKFNVNDTQLSDRLSGSTQSLVQCRSTLQQCQILHDTMKQSH